MGVENVLDKDSILGVGGGTDGASVNVGVHTGLKAQMLCHGYTGHGATLTVWS